MWISKKKFERMMAEAMEKEREREMVYRFMEEMSTRMGKVETQVEENTKAIRNSAHYVPRSNGKKRLNG